MTEEEIRVKLGVDGTALGQGLRKAKEQVADWGNAIKSTIEGAFTVVAVKALVDSTVEYAAHIFDLSKRLGISTDALQVWDFAMKKTGGSIDSAAGFFEKMASARDNAVSGDMPLLSAFQQLGVSIDDLKGKRIEDIAEQISEVFKGGDPQKLIGALKEVGGRGAGEMVGALVAGLKEAREEAERLGLIIDTKTVASLKEASDRMEQVSMTLKAALAPWVSAMAEGLQYLFDLVTQKSAWLGTFIGGIASGNGFKASSDAADAAEQAEFEKMIERDKAAERARNTPAHAGGSDAAHKATAEEKEERKKIDELNKESAKNENKATEKQKDLEEQLNDLLEKRADIQADAETDAIDELQSAMDRNELSKNELEILAKQKEIKEEMDKIDKAKESIAVKQKERLEESRASFQPTIEELAKSGFWGRQQRNGSGPLVWKQSGFAKDAQEIERLKADAKNSFEWGNTGRADNDIARANFLRGNLERAGIISPERRLESIDEEIKTLNKVIIDGKGKIGVVVDQ